MIRVCDLGHEPVCIETEICPLCNILEKLDICEQDLTNANDRINVLENENKELKDRVDEFEHAHDEPPEDSERIDR